MDKHLKSKLIITEKDWEYSSSFSVKYYFDKTSKSLNRWPHCFADRRFLKLIYCYLFDDNTFSWSRKCIEPIQKIPLFRARKYKKPDAYERLSNP